jgi:hypothetical protein
LKWDLDVDMVCTGSGAAGLATAIAGADLGGEVFVAQAPRNDTASEPLGALHAQSGQLHPWLGPEVCDPETTDYLAALSSDSGPLRLEVREAALPISVVRELPVEQTRTVPPFFGERLRDWTARCLASPYGFLHTRLADDWSTTMYTDAGEPIEVTEIGVLTTDSGASDNLAVTLLDFLREQVRARAVEIHPDCALQRIVFEDGEAVGVVFATGDGPLAVRARFGITVATGPQTDAAPPQQPAAIEPVMRVCLVSRQASRFGRVELLTSKGPAGEAASTCQQDRLQLRANLRETQGESPVWRCAWGDGYPPVGQ